MACSDLFDTPFTIADMDASDHPAIHVNKLFETITGYASHEVIGRNFRFLQGELTARETVRHIRAAVDGGRAVHVDIINYKKDGTPFWNRMVILPLTDAGRRFCIGIQLDVSKRKEDIIGKEVSELSLPEASPHQIHHEIRTPLSVIANAYLLLTETPPPERSEHLTKMVRRAVIEIASYVHGLPWTPTRRT